MGSHAFGGHGGAAVERLASAARVPTLVQWLVTTECELRCPHCLAPPGSDATPSTPLALGRSIVDQVAAAGIEELLLTGGEPLGYARLPEILAHMAEREVAYSLNTARMPAGAAREALERHPPTFVAVSLDGPREVHDAFRGRQGAFDESLASMRFFRGLGAYVAAGTTVTRRNQRHLIETLAIVQRSAAHRWGLHLLVPEGRARHRPDLFLRRADLRRLVRFVEEKRSYVRLEMADELGHLGEREPLLRDLPMTCGAGRKQCVILPGGEVVPCTTLDRSASAGSLLERPLLEIWRDGFATLRSRAPAPRCVGCAYFAACGGGCWLQSRETARCFKDVWEGDEARGRAAGLVVALGLLGAQGCGSCAPPPDAQAGQHAAGEAPGGDQPGGPARGDPGDVARGAADRHAALPTYELPLPRPLPAGTQDPPLVVEGPRGARVDLSAELGGALEAAIVRLTLQGPSPAVAAQVRAATPPSAADDPAFGLVQARAEGRAPEALVPRARAVREALGTSRPSLGLCALGLRVLAEPFLAEPFLAEPFLAEPFLAEPFLAEPFLAEPSLAGPFLDGTAPERRTAAERAAVREALGALGSAAESWRAAIFGARLDPYLARGGEHARHQFMMLKSRPQPPPELALLSDTAEERWGPAGQGIAADWLARHPHAEALQLGLGSPGPGLVLLGAGRSAPVGPATTMGVFDLLVVPAAETRVDVRWAEGAPLTVRLPAGAELTYVDLLRLADAQHRAALEALARRADGAEGNPLLLSHMHRTGARAWLADFWLF